MTRAIAFVFARGGSKGVPGKNLRTVAGVPMIVRAIRTGQQCPGIERVVVSTDSEAIAEVAIAAGAEVPELRPTELASDTASELDAWKHAVGWFTGAGGPDFDLFVSLPPTAPLRRPTTVSACIAKFQGGGFDIVVTGSTAHRHPAFNMVEVDSDGLAKLLMPRSSGLVRRQDAPPAFDLATVAYVSSPRWVLSTSAVLAGRVGLVEVDRAEALDIDDELDVAVANALAERMQP